LALWGSHLQTKEDVAPGSDGDVLVRHSSKEKVFPVTEDEEDFGDAGAEGSPETTIAVKLHEDGDVVVAETRVVIEDAADDGVTAEKKTEDKEQVAVVVDVAEEAVSSDIAKEVHDAGDNKSESEGGDSVDRFVLRKVCVRVWKGILFSLT
jgi:hypothetical protein